jgi:hypothetical protein
MGSAGAVDFLQQFGTRLVMVDFDRIAGSFSKRQRAAAGEAAIMAVEHRGPILHATRIQAKVGRPSCWLDP